MTSHLLAMMLVVLSGASLSGKSLGSTAGGKYKSGHQYSGVFLEEEEVRFVSVCQRSSLMFDMEAWESGVGVPVVTDHTVYILQLLVIPVSVVRIVGKRRLSVFVETGGVNVSFFS